MTEPATARIITARRISKSDDPRGGPVSPKPQYADLPVTPNCFCTHTRPLGSFEKRQKFSDVALVLGKASEAANGMTLPGS